MLNNVDVGHLHVRLILINSVEEIDLVYDEFLTALLKVFYG